MRSRRLTISVAAAVIAVDATAKAIVAAALTPGRVVHVVPGLQLDLYYNHAGAGNALTGRSTIVSVLAIVAVLAIAVMARQPHSRSAATALGLLLGGGIGNLVDRIFGGSAPLHGGVIDWIRLFGGSGSMNLADLAINAGVIVMIAGAVFTATPSPRRSGSPHPDCGR